jgi:hypothetical protein
MSHFDWFKRLADDGDGSDEEFPLENMWERAIQVAYMHCPSDFQVGDQVQDMATGKCYEVVQVEPVPTGWVVLRRNFISKVVHLDGPYADNTRRWRISEKGENSETDS